MNPSNKSLTITIVVLAIVVLVGIGSYRIWGIRWWEYLRRTPAEESLGNVLPPTEKGGEEKEETASPAENESAGKTAPPPPAVVGMGEYTLGVSNQPAGNRVEVASVTAPTNVWVVVHEDQDGRPGRALGAERFRMGRAQGAVDLLRNTASGAVYYAILHSDDGNSAFELDKDLPLQDESGEIISVRFNAQ